MHTDNASHTVNFADDIVVIADLLNHPFAVPFLTGACVASLVSFIGLFLRLRDEWLAALALAHLSAAGALGATAIGLPAAAGALSGALSGVPLKQLARGSGNTVYMLIYLCAWSALMLIATNSSLGYSIGQALLDGQLYFVDTRHLWAALVAIVTLAFFHRWLTKHLARARIQPDFERANRLPAWKWHLGTDTAVALIIALAMATLGIVATFAMAFVPAWVAFRLAPSWRACWVIAIGLGLLSHILAFNLALAFDQPFGPVLVAVLGAMAILSLAAGARRRQNSPTPD